MDDQENPTAGNSGASIEDRLVAYLAPQEAPKQEEVKQEAPAQVEDKPADTGEKTEKPVDDAKEEVKQPQITTADLAEALGIDESALDVGDDGKVVIKSKIDGKEGAAKLAEILKTYQIQGHAENKARAVAEQEKALQTRTQEAEQAFKQRLDHAEALASLAMQDLMSEYNQYDWKALDSHQDQGAVVALKLKFQERAAKIQGALQGVNAQKAQLGEKAKAQRAEFLAKEAERIPEVIPAWKDKAVAEKESKEIVEWGLKAGYSREQMAALNESSALHVATVRKAMLYDQQQESKALVEKKVRTAPVIVKPGQTQQDSKGEKLQSLKQQVIKSGGKSGSVAAWLVAAGKV